MTIDPRMVRLVDWSWKPDLPTTRLTLRFLHPDEATPKQLAKALKSAVRQARRELKSGSRYRLKASLVDLPGPLSRSTIELTLHAHHADEVATRIRALFSGAFIAKLARKSHTATLEV